MKWFENFNNSLSCQLSDFSMTILTEETTSSGACTFLANFLKYFSHAEGVCCCEDCPIWLSSSKLILFGFHKRVLAHFLTVGNTCIINTDGVIGSYGNRVHINVDLDRDWKKTAKSPIGFNCVIKLQTNMFMGSKAITAKFCQQNPHQCNPSKDWRQSFYICIEVR